MKNNIKIHFHQLNCLAEVAKYNTPGIPKRIKDTENLILSIIKDLNARPRYVWLIQNIGGYFVGLVGLVLGKPNFLVPKYGIKFIQHEG